MSQKVRGKGIYHGKILLIQGEYCIYDDMQGRRNAETKKTLLESNGPLIHRVLSLRLIAFFFFPSLHYLSLDTCLPQPTSLTWTRLRTRSRRYNVKETQTSMQVHPRLNSSRPKI